MVEALDPRSSKHVEYYLFPGSGILALEACGLKLEALATGLEACSLLLGARTRAHAIFSRRC
jgi:hypothetical protein